jgi:hypothetical protein
MGEKGGGLLIEQRRKLPHQECPSLGVKPVKGCKRGYHPPIRKTGIPYTGRYQVEVEGDLIVSDSRDPETDLARALLSRGITGMVKVMDANNKKHRCTVDIEKAAKLRTVEGPHGPRFVAYQTCLDRAPVSETGLPCTPLPEAAE